MGIWPPIVQLILRQDQLSSGDTQTEKRTISTEQERKTSKQPLKIQKVEPRDLIVYISENRASEEVIGSYHWLPTIDEVVVFMKDVQKILPQYWAYFTAAEKKTGVDCHLLAALAYQESHWQKSAKSPTGVRGFMQITKGTAKALAMKSRSIPQEITAAAMYLSSIRKSLVGSETEKLWKTIAAYNIGPHDLSHIQRKSNAVSGKKMKLWGSESARVQQAVLTVEKVEVYYLLLKYLIPNY